MNTQYCAQCMKFLELDPKLNKGFLCLCELGEARVVDCAGCGTILVNHLGECLTQCEDKHGVIEATLPPGDYLIFPNGTYIKDNFRSKE